MSVVRSISRQRHCPRARRALYDPLDESKDVEKETGHAEGSFHSTRPSFRRRLFFADESCTRAKNVLVNGDACIGFIGEQHEGFQRMESVKKKGRKNSGNVANSEWLVDQLYYFLPVMHVSVSIYGAKKLVRTKEEVEEDLRGKTM